MLDETVRWVLRNARQHAADPRVRSATGFAAGVVDGVTRAPAVHRAQVGRWETGKAELTYELVRRYEIVLGLPEGQLLCAIEHLSRDEQPVRSVPTFHPRETPSAAETRDLIEKAFGIDRMTGLDWDRLSDALGRLPNALIREVDWQHLLRRCSQELSVSLGLEYALRNEAMARLAGHVRSGPVVARMTRAVLVNPASQVYSDLLAPIQYSDHPDAIAVLLEQLESPTNHDALRAALFALTTIVRSDRVPADVNARVARLAIEHLRDESRPFTVHRAAAFLVRALDLPQHQSLASSLRADDLEHAATIILEGRSLASEPLLATLTRVRAHLDETFGSDPAPVLRDLLMRVIATTDDESRNNALCVLMLSPQGAVVGSAYAAELARAQEAGDAAGTSECLSVLSFLAQPADLDLLLGLACCPETDPTAAMEAGLAAGNAGEPDGPLAWERDERVFRVAADLVAGRSAGSVTGSAVGDGRAADEAFRQRLRGLSYFLGMRGRYDLLERLGRGVDPTLPHARTSRGSVEWWLHLPEWTRPEPRGPDAAQAAASRG